MDLPVKPLDKGRKRRENILVPCGQMMAFEGRRELRYVWQ